MNAEISSECFDSGFHMLARAHPQPASLHGQVEATVVHCETLRHLSETSEECNAGRCSQAYPICTTTTSGSPLRAHCMSSLDLSSSVSLPPTFAGYVLSIK